jgi:2-polyprenyl-3-methyl-5-hydroxy-6-metoxy-1,4-benzoquinol methylase
MRPALRGPGVNQDTAQFWGECYRGVHEQTQGWLDYSNELVQLQGFALALEAAGAIRGRSDLDVGCGKGQFTRMMRDLGASLNSHRIHRC